MKHLVLKESSTYIELILSFQNKLTDKKKYFLWNMFSDSFRYFFKN